MLDKLWTKMPQLTCICHSKHLHLVLYQTVSCDIFFCVPHTHLAWRNVSTHTLKYASFYDGRTSHPNLTVMSYVGSKIRAKIKKFYARKWSYFDSSNKCSKIRNIDNFSMKNDMITSVWCDTRPKMPNYTHNAQLPDTSGREIRPAVRHFRP